MVKRKTRSWNSESGSSNDSSSGDAESSSSDGGSEDTSSSDDGSEYSSSSDDGSASQQNPAIASFSLSQVLFGEEDSGSEDAYQSNGKSVKRVRRALKTPCCARQCKRRLVFRTVMCLVTSFWALTKSGQDAILWSLQHPMWMPQAEDEEEETSGTSSSSSSSASSKTTGNVAWYLEGGVAMGCQACMQLLVKCLC